MAALVALADPLPASASVDGTGSARGADLTAVSVTIDGTEVIPGIDLTLAEATTPPPDADGNGTDSVTVAAVGPLLTATVISAEVDRTTSGLTSDAAVADMGLEVLGIDLVGASAITSTSDCPIPELGVPTNSVSVTDLTIDGNPATVGAVDVAVDLDPSGLGADSARLLVDVTQTTDSTATTASATALEISVDLVVDFPVGSPEADIDLNVVDLSLAATACSQPAGVAPTATALVPDNGPELTSVTIEGSGFIPGDTTVDLGGTTIDAGDVTVAPDGTTAEFVVPDDFPLGPVDVTATTPVGTTGPLTFTVTPAPPTASALDPTQGPETTTVTMTGDNFIPGSTSVDFGGTTIGAADVTVAPDGNTLTFDVPTGSDLGPTAVTATTTGGTTGPLDFIVTSADAPSMLTLTPTQGPETTTVTVNGDDFVPGATTVGFGAQTIGVADVTVAADGESLTFDVPVGSPFGPTDVTVTTPAGTGGPLGFLVTSAVAPAATALYPPSGPEGTTVTVSGSDFVPSATTVDFGGATIAAADVVVDPDGETLYFVVPDGSPLGATDVTATTPAGTTSPLVFTVTEMPDAPTASAIDPDEGPTGTTVTITGTDFVPGGTSVDFGGITVGPTATAVSVGGDTVTFVVPSGAPLGVTDVTATTPAGTTGPLQFVVTSPNPPTVTDLDPDAGPVGTTVTVTGSDFVPGATEVEFGSLTIAVGDVTVSGGGTTLTFVVPDAAPLGATPVVVSTPTGDSGPVSFEVTPSAPTVDGVDPGSAAPGTVIVVIGSGFVPGQTGVWIGGTYLPPTQVTVTDPGTLSFVLPAGSTAGPTTLAVQTPNGTSNAMGFTVLSAVSPFPGPNPTRMVSTGSGTLPYTGGSADSLVVVGMLLVFAGAAAVGASWLVRAGRRTARR